MTKSMQSGLFIISLMAGIIACSGPRILPKEQVALDMEIRNAHQSEVGSRAPDTLSKARYWMDRAYKAYESGDEAERAHSAKMAQIFLDTARTVAETQQYNEKARQQKEEIEKVNKEIEESGKSLVQTYTNIAHMRRIEGLDVIATLEKQIKDIEIIGINESERETLEKGKQKLGEAQAFRSGGKNDEAIETANLGLVLIASIWANAQGRRDEALRRGKYELVVKKIRSTFPELEVRTEERGVVLALPNCFERRETNVNENGFLFLKALAPIIKEFKEFHIILEGHADSTEKRGNAEELTLERANSFKESLVQMGIPGSRLEIRGMGVDRPLTSNDTAEGKATNRRIEAVFQLLTR